MKIHHKYCQSLYVYDAIDGQRVVVLENFTFYR